MGAPHHDPLAEVLGEEFERILGQTWRLFNHRMFVTVMKQRHIPWNVMFLPGARGLLLEDAFRRDGPHLIVMHVLMKLALEVWQNVPLCVVVLYNLLEFCNMLSEKAIAIDSEMKACVLAKALQVQAFAKDASCFTPLQRTHLMNSARVFMAWIHIHDFIGL